MDETVVISREPSALLLLPQSPRVTSSSPFNFPQDLTCCFKRALILMHDKALWPMQPWSCGPRFLLQPPVPPSDLTSATLCAACFLPQGFAAASAVWTHTTRDVWRRLILTDNSWPRMTGVSGYIFLSFLWQFWGNLPHGSSAGLWRGHTPLAYISGPLIMRFLFPLPRFLICSSWFLTPMRNSLSICLRNSSQTLVPGQLFGEPLG